MITIPGEKEDNVLPFKAGGEKVNEVYLRMAAAEMKAEGRFEGPLGDPDFDPRNKAQMDNLPEGYDHLVEQHSDPAHRQRLSAARSEELRSSLKEAKPTTEGLNK